MKKGVVLVVVIGVALVVFTLVLAAFSLMTQESRIAEHKIKRTRAFFAAQAGMVHAFELLRNGSNPSGTIYIGSGVTGYPSAGLPVIITYTAGAGTGPGGTDPVNITVNY
ncbi:MAG: hypothetical protein HQ570_01725 [Candidatus Omnitrophica bacterium]|nr:hypothetical protein [Candidatus Omnitrophota bacterium]